MCNYSELVLETGIKKGLRKGRRRGRQQGRREGFETVAIRMLKMKTYDDEEILRLSGISPGRLDRLKKLVTVSPYLKDRA